MRWKFITWLTIKATLLSDLLLQSRHWTYTIKDFQNMPAYSIGHRLFQYLKQHQITYKPKLIRHDVKHILLGYDMTINGELKIQAFLLGNRSHNLFGLIHLSTCLIFVPEIIPELLKDYRRGKHAICLKQVNLEDFVTRDVNQARQQLSIL